MIRKTVMLVSLLMSLALPLLAGTLQVNPEVKKDLPIQAPPLKEIKPMIKVTHPAPGITIKHACMGKTQEISWDYVGDIGATVNILIKGSSSGLVTINGVPAGANMHGSYSWLLPENLTDGKGEGGMFTVTVQAGNGSATATGGKIQVDDPRLGPCSGK
ncbi:MAG: hypothetical protein M0036_10095 [Desulfobacteraceae bacterium]|nr:hypothetical protein [Desulfobacteraceae bacterium]